MIKCKRGHLQTKENIYIRPNGYKKCRICRKINKKKYMKKHKEEIRNHNKKYRQIHKEQIKKYWKKYRWYRHYHSAKQRCNNSKHSSYKNYGGKGIKMLMTVKDFKFLWFRDKAYLMKQPSIDRKNSNKNYTLKNCQFIKLSENNRKDMIGKKHNTKLTKKQVKQIRKLYAKGDITQNKLGIKFEVCRQTITNIISYKNWK